MNGRERYAAIMEYRPFDRLPVWFFDAWDETRPQWVSQGLSDWSNVAQETGMDPDWERGMWQCHGLVKNRAISGLEREVLEETDEYIVVRTPLGAIIKDSKTTSIPHHVKEALEPTWESWRRFKKYLDPHDPSRRPPGWEIMADQLEKRTHCTTFLAGSLFGWPRDWLGVEQVSLLSYDDPVLYEDIISTITDFFIEIHRPVLQRVHFDFAYIFEDCCGRSGPLFSPDTYRKHYHKHYSRLFEFYRANGVKHIMLDSDGYVEPLIPCWMESGVDILFPIEVGTWKASAVDIRRKFGRDLRMMGGVDKHVIPMGEKAIREHLEPMRPVVAEGGFIPIPDHRIPPSCSLEQFKTYVRVFKETFADCGGPRK